MQTVIGNNLTYFYSFFRVDLVFPFHGVFYSYFLIFKLHE